MARDFDALMAGDDEGAGIRAALRLVAWGGVAACAIAVATLAARTDNGAQRLAQILSGPTRAAADSPVVPTAAALAARLAETESESQRLSETVRRLTADRELVVARLEALERSMDVTASIRENTQPATTPASQPTPTAPVAQTAPPPVPAAPPPGAPAQANVTSAGSILTPNPLIPATTTAPTPPMAGASTPPTPRVTTVATVATTPAGGEQTNLGAIAGPAAESTATRTEFGVDLGGDRTVDALRAMWNSLKAGKHAALLEGLRPVVAVREGGKSSGVELRLVVGPLANAVAAARLCGSLAAAGLACQPTVFDGQRLALR